jgi:hypothetical protein
MLLLPAPVVRADVAPPPPPAGANVQPTAETQVRMLAEVVVIEAQRNNYGDPARATVQADFTMRNMGSAAEQMKVRFPLNVLFPMYQADPNECVFPAAFPEISDFRAEVNGRAAAVTNTIQRVKNPLSAANQARDVKCWANFDAAFPPGEDVRIRVRYSVEGYAAWDTPGQIEFPYVLLTGEAWQGTIGRAEIIFRAPFPLDARTLMQYFPQEGQVTGNEVRWVFEDFEPESNVSATIMNPALHARIQREEAALAKNSRDGEAWGRLGRWYKEANRLRRGFRFDPGGEKLYFLSKEAYEKAVTLLPKDADWHAGYAELLCWNGWFDGFGGMAAKRDDLVACADQVRLALAINPKQAKALEIFETLSFDGITRLEGSKRDYPALTLTPTILPQVEVPLPPTATPTPTGPEPTPTPEPERPTQTPILIAKVDLTRTAEVVNTAAAKPTDVLPTVSPKAPIPARRPGLCVSLFAPAAAAVWMASRRRRL